MTFRRPARVLAPLVLLACAGAVYAVVHTTLSDDATEDSTVIVTTPARTTTTATSKRKTYVVKSGDTLGAISVRYGVSVARLQKLNPDVDPQSLHAGQRLKLRE